jgi:hypothetical protein
MPERIQFYLNIDFPGARKFSPGGSCRAEGETGQNLPVGGNFCRVGGK